MEWRLARRDGVWHPYATILRWSIDAGEANPAMQSLIVTKVSPEESCQAAIVMIGLVAEANQVARDQADGLGFAFDCRHDEPYMIPS